MDGIHTLIEFSGYLKKAYGLQKLREDEELLQNVRGAIERAVNKYLTYRQYECFYMYYKHGLTVYEIADQLRITPPTVSRHLKRARNKLYREIKNFIYPKSRWS